MSKTNDEKPIKVLLSELDEHMERFDASDLDIDEALKSYEQASEVIKALEERIKKAELKINDIKKSL